LTIPLHDINEEASQSLQSIDNVLSEYNKFKVGHNWILSGTEVDYIDSKIATFVLENKQLFESKLLESMKQLPKVYSRLNIEQEKEIVEIIEKMQNGLKPDVWATTDIAGVQYEVMYCEISGMPFKLDPIHIEEDRRKLFRLGVRVKILFNKNIVEQYVHALTNHLIQSISLLTIPLLRFYRPINIPIQNLQRHKFKTFTTRIEVNNGNITPIRGSLLHPLSLSKTPLRS
ncbi:17319_t:CDS:2, partial [Dentiscutata heterogama]